MKNMYVGLFKEIRLKRGRLLSYSNSYIQDFIDSITHPWGNILLTVSF